uniref:Uncharacterized protein n=1 Tax=Oryza brachyantha TaxID=4533 RepID=J3LHN2_ORYBR
MQSADTLMLGQIPKGGTASTMEPTAMRGNEKMGVIDHDQATDATAGQGVTVSETHVPGGRIITEFVAGQSKVEAITDSSLICINSHEDMYKDCNEQNPPPNNGTIHHYINSFRTREYNYDDNYDIHWSRYKVYLLNLPHQPLLAKIVSCWEELDLVTQ